MENCSKCGGYGYIPSYSSIKNGTCFQCGGVNIRGKTLNEAEKDKVREKKEKIKRSVDLHKKIYSLENTIELFKTSPPKNEEERQFLNKRIGLLREYKIEYEQLGINALGHL